MFRHLFLLAQLHTLFWKFFATDAMRTLSHYFIVGHVHDELIIECSKDVDLTTICEQMGRTLDWINGLLLRADVYETEFYKKD